MNRNERRKQESEQQKLKKWFSSLTPQQAKFHKELVRKIVQDSNEKTELIVDSCYIGAILQHTEMELSECIKIAKLANVNMEETSQYLNKESGYYTMVNDEKLRDKIRQEAKKIQKEGKKITEGIKQLKTIYNLPQKDLHVIWAEAKEDLKNTNPVKSNVSTDKEKEEFFNSIGVKNDKILLKGKINKVSRADEKIINNEVTERLPYSISEKEIEEERKIAIENNKTKSNIVFKDNGNVECKIEIEPTIKRVSETFQGKYGTYSRTSEGVTDNRNTFKDINAIEKYKAQLEAVSSSQKSDLKARITELNNQLAELEEIEQKELRVLVEIEQIFNLK